MTDQTVDAGSITAEEFRTRVVAELNRLAALPTVNEDSGRADSFGTGARWALRMIREAVAGRVDLLDDIQEVPAAEASADHFRGTAEVINLAVARERA